MSGGCCSCSPVDETPQPDSRDDLFWIRLGLALVLAGQSMVFGLAINISSPAYGSTSYYWLHGALIASALVSIGLLGPRLARESWAAARVGRITVEALFVVTCLGALVGSLIATFTGVGSVYYEVVAIVLAVYSVGKRIGGLSRDRVLREIAGYRETFDRARRRSPEGEDMWVPTRSVQKGDRVRVDPGEPVPVDGIVDSGDGFVEQSQLTGEPIPVRAHPGSEIHAGSWSVDGTFLIRTDRTVGERRIDEILSLVEEARAKPSRLQTWADRTIGWFFPFVVLSAFGVFLGWFFAGAGWAEALFNAMAVLLVACPCALGLATPIAVWRSLFELANQGLLCRHGETLDALAKTRRIFFDKTGTLSDARLVVRDFQIDPSSPHPPDRLRQWVAAIESEQEHPVARALASIANPGGVSVLERRILPGRGIEGRIRQDGQTFSLSIGPAEGDPENPAPSPHFKDLPENAKTTATLPKADTEPVASGSGLPSRYLRVRVEGRPAARILVEEALRGGSEETLGALHDRSIAVEILSGDPNSSWKQIGGVSVEGSLSPEEKANRVRDSIRRGEEPLFVGDGINDTPAMAAGAASISIAEGAALPRGTADAVLTSNDLARIPQAIDLARRVHAGVAGNIRFAVFYNVIGISLAAAGVLHPVVAALLMLASSATVSIRALRSARLQP